MAQIRRRGSGAASYSDGEHARRRAEREDEDEESEHSDFDDDEDGGCFVDEPPPPMNASSGSDADTPSPKQSKKAIAAAAAAAAAKKRKAQSPGSKVKSPTKGKKPSTAAPAAASTPSKGSSNSSSNGGGEEPGIWKAFAAWLSRDDYERLRLIALNQWQGFEKGPSIPPQFRTWYATQIKGHRSVPQAVSVPPLPTGFPEFCHWVADDRNAAYGSSLMAGFGAMAVHFVNKVEAAERAALSPASAAPAAAGSSTTAGVSGSSSVDPKARRRDRRARKGASGTNGANFAEKMQSALAGLDRVGLDETKRDVNEAEGSAAGRAFRAGLRAESEVGTAIRAASTDADSSTFADMVGPAFADSNLQPGTLSMLGSLKRAKSLRRRSERQSELLEDELERCVSRLASIEGQYHSLVAETTGRECTLEHAVARALSLIEEAKAHTGRGVKMGAMESYDNAVKMLEVHVTPTPGPAEDQHSRRARELLGLALCNRSVTNFMLGNAYNGKRDAVKAVTWWPCATSKEHQKRSNEFYKKHSPPAPGWSTFPVP